MADNSSEIKKLKQLIENSGRILITSHISPDPDAVSSVLLLMRTLKLNFPHKTIHAALEEEPSDLDFLQGYQALEFKPLSKELEAFKPDLFILLDGNNYERASRKDGQKIRDYVAANRPATVVIDHHEEAGKDDVDIFINRQSPSTVQDIYRICFDELGFKKPAGSAQTAMTGFYADTGGFVYLKAGQSDKVFGFADKLVNDGADVESVKYRLESYSEADMAVIGELAGNIAHDGDYTYSYLNDNFVAGWLSSGHSHSDLQRGTNMFLNGFIRNIDGRRWGFIVYKNSLEGDDIYSASFRSQAGQPDVSAIARQLGGGGHKPAAGARFEARSIEDAVHGVKAVIKIESK
jgi:phosphoesterase RecJ-like protein